MADMTCVYGCVIRPVRVSVGILLPFYSPLQVHYCSLMAPFSSFYSVSLYDIK